MEQAISTAQRSGNSRADRKTKASGTTTRSGTVFGLDVHAEIPLSFLEGASAEPGGRRLEISASSGDGTKLEWPQDAELVCDERAPDGAQIFRIESHPQAGYLISGPQYGSFLLSADGGQLRCCREDCPENNFQQLLIAQVLPFASLLQGLEVFHAGAVVKDGQAVALLGRSGAGKTSIALECCRRGASFLADDVLALEPNGDALLAHPGTALAGVDHAEGEHIGTGAGLSSEQIFTVDSRKQLVRMTGAVEPAPLGALFFLDRRPDGPEHPRFEPATDARMLLSSTFNFVLSTPERLRRLLEVCALAAQLRVERMVVCSAADSSELAGAIVQRLSPSP